MSAADTQAVIDRIGAKRAELGAEDFAAYAFLALGILSGSAPEVVEFIFDRADDALSSPRFASQLGGDKP